MRDGETYHKSMKNILNMIEWLIFFVIANFALLIFFVCARKHKEHPKFFVGPRAVYFEFAIDEPIIFEDNDNDGIDVHDSGIQGALMVAIKKLNSTVHYDRKCITDEINKHDDVQIRMAALDTLSTMELLNGMFHMHHELDILMMVYNRFQQKKLDTSTLVEELADAKGKCLVGRITRIVQSLECLDDDVSLKSTDLYKTELTDSFLFLRKKFLAKLPINMREYYERFYEEDEKHMILLKSMTKYIDKNLRKQYVKSGLLINKLYLSLTQELFNNL